jgi:AraC-like DNA-binding protein
MGLLIEQARGGSRSAPAADLGARGLQHLHFTSPRGSWDLCLLPPALDLAPFVDVFWCSWGCADYARQVVMPTTSLELMFNLTRPYRVIDASDPAGASEFRTAWIAGLHDGPLVIEPDFDPRVDEASLVSVRFKPQGSYAFFGLPQHEITNRVLELDEILGAAVREVHERLAGAADLVERFRLIEAFVRRSVQRSGARAHRGVEHALAMLQMSGGAARVGRVCDAIGWTRKTLNQRFQREVGLSPKRYARILKFRRVLGSIAGEQAVNWSAIAHECGYYDQAHFNHDFRVFTGCTPTAFLQHRGPEGDYLLTD